MSSAAGTLRSTRYDADRIGKDVEGDREDLSNGAACATGRRGLADPGSSTQLAGASTSDVREDVTNPQSCLAAHPSGDLGLVKGDPMNLFLVSSPMFNGTSPLPPDACPPYPANLNGDAYTSGAVRSTFTGTGSNMAGSFSSDASVRRMVDTNIVHRTVAGMTSQPPTSSLASASITQTAPPPPMVPSNASPRKTSKGGMAAAAPGSLAPSRPPRGSDAVEAFSRASSSAGSDAYARVGPFDVIADSASGKAATATDRIPRRGKRGRGNGTAPTRLDPAVQGDDLPQDLNEVEGTNEPDEDEPAGGGVALQPKPPSTSKPKHGDAAPALRHVHHHNVEEPDSHVGDAANASANSPKHAAAAAGILNTSERNTSPEPTKDGLRSEQLPEKPLPITSPSEVTSSIASSKPGILSAMSTGRGVNVETASGEGASLGSGSGAEQQQRAGKAHISPAYQNLSSPSVKSTKYLEAKKKTSSFRKIKNLLTGKDKKQPPSDTASASDANKPNGSSRSITNSVGSGGEGNTSVTQITSLLNSDGRFIAFNEDPSVTSLSHANGDSATNSTTGVVATRRSSTQVHGTNDFYNVSRAPPLHSSFSHNTDQVKIITDLFIKNTLVLPNIYYESNKAAASAAAFKRARAAAEKSGTDVLDVTNLYNLHDYVFETSPPELRNFGATCYLNAVVQCILFSPDLILALQSHMDGVELTEVAEGKRSSKDSTGPAGDKGAATSGSSTSRRGSSRRPSGKNESPDRFVATRSLIQLALRRSTPAVISQRLQTIKAAAAKYNSEFESNGQNDSHEFLRTFLYVVHDENNVGHPSNFTMEEENKKNEAPESGTSSKAVAAPSPKVFSESAELRKWVNKIKEVDSSIVYYFFGGILRSKCQCSACGNESYTFDPFLDLSLPLSTFPERSKIPIRSVQSNLGADGGSSGGGGTPTADSATAGGGGGGGSNKRGAGAIGPTTTKTEYQLNDILKYAFVNDSAETLDEDNKLHCDRCKSMQDAVRKVKVLLWPKILVLHLKRFDQFGRKNDNKVIYPQYLHFSPDELFNPNGGGSANKGQQGISYRLYAVCCHRGTERFGHYTSYVCLQKRVKPGEDNDPNGNGNNNNNNSSTNALPSLPSSKRLKQAGQTPNASSSPNAASANAGSGRNNGGAAASSGMRTTSENWYLCNDRTITPSSIEQVLSAVEEAYILFYYRM